MQPIPLSQFTSAVLDVYSGPRYSPATLGRMKMVLGQLARLDVQTTADLTTAVMVRYVQWLGAKAALGTDKPVVGNPNTVNGYLAMLATACTFAVEEGWLDRPPVWRRVRLRPAPMVKNTPPDYDDLAALLAHLGRQTDWEGRRLAALAWLVSLTGLRLREALYGAVADLDLERAEFRVEPGRQPTGRLKTADSARTVPLTEPLVAVLGRWRDSLAGEWLFPGRRSGRPWDGGNGSSRPLGALQAAARQIGLEHVTWHSLRHAYGTFALERWGVPLWVVQQVMGHRSIRTTEHYLHLKGSPRIRDGVRGVGAGFTRPEA